LTQPKQGIMYLDAPLILMLVQRWPHLRRPCCVAGVLFMAVGLVASSFSQSVWQLILTQGVLYAIGGSLIYNPVLVLLDEWFVRRKGMAYGIMWVSLSVL
jgi:MFS family permease